MSKSLMSGKLSNGVSIEILEAESFSGKTEFAVKVAGEIASVSTVSVIRNGDVLVKTSTKSIRVKAASNPAAPQTPAPSL